LTLAAARGRQAEQNFSDALETVRRSLVILGNERLAPVPEVEDARRDALENAALMLRRLGERRAIREPSLDRELARTHVGMGRIQLVLGHHDQAEGSFQQALTILESLAARPADEGSPDREIADVETLIARSLGAAMAPAAVREAHFDRAISLLEKLSSRDPLARDALAAAHDAAGTVEGSPHRLAHASRAVEIYGDDAHSDPTSHPSEFARALFNLAKAKREEGASLEFESIVRRCLNIWDSIPVDRLDDFDRRGLAECLHTLGLQMLDRAVAENRRDMPIEAVEMVRRGLKVHEQLVLRQPRVHAFRDGLSRAYNGFGIALGRAGRYQEAVAAFQSAEVTREALIQTFPERLDEPFLLAEVLVNKATYEVALRDTKRFFGTFDRAIKLLEAHTKLRPHWARVHSALSKAYQNLAIQMSAAGRLQEALRLHDQSIASFETANQLPRDSSADDLQGVFVHAARAQTWAKFGRFDRAAADWKRAGDLSDTHNRAYYIVMQALALANDGDHEVASRVLDGLAATSHITAETHYNAACACSLALRAVDRDGRLDIARKKDRRTALLDAAMKHLDAARATGFFADPAMVANLQADTDLEAIRPEPRFTEFSRTLQPAPVPGVRSAQW
jgi:tetratricopeptide (TPR) repeat protein